MEVANDSEKDLKRLLTAVYSLANPDKLSTGIVDKAAKRYQGYEDILANRLAGKYADIAKAETQELVFFVNQAHRSGKLKRRDSQPWAKKARLKMQEENTAATTTDSLSKDKKTDDSVGENGKSKSANTASTDDRTTISKDGKEELKKLLTNVYKIANPEKLKENIVEYALERYAGYEDVLAQRLAKKYADVAGDETQALLRWITRAHSKGNLKRRDSKAWAQKARASIPNMDEVDATLGLLEPVAGTRRGSVLLPDQRPGSAATKHTVPPTGIAESVVEPTRLVDVELPGSNLVATRNVRESVVDTENFPSGVGVKRSKDERFDVSAGTASERSSGTEDAEIKLSPMSRGRESVVDTNAFPSEAATKRQRKSKSESTTASATSAAAVPTVVTVEDSETQLTPTSRGRGSVVDDGAFPSEAATKRSAESKSESAATSTPSATAVPTVGTVEDSETQLTSTSSDKKMEDENLRKLDNTDAANAKAALRARLLSLYTTVDPSKIEQGVVDKALSGYAGYEDVLAYRLREKYSDVEPELVRNIVAYVDDAHASGHIPRRSSVEWGNKARADIAAEFARLVVVLQRAWRRYLRRKKRKIAPKPPADEEDPASSAVVVEDHVAPLAPVSHAEHRDSTMVGPSEAHVVSTNTSARVEPEEAHASKRASLDGAMRPTTPSSRSRELDQATEITSIEKRKVAPKPLADEEDVASSAVVVEDHVAPLAPVSHAEHRDSTMVGPSEAHVVSTNTSARVEPEEAHASKRASLDGAMRPTTPSSRSRELGQATERKSIGDLTMNLHSIMSKGEHKIPAMIPYEVKISSMDDIHDIADHSDVNEDDAEHDIPAATDDDEEIEDDGNDDSGGGSGGPAAVVVVGDGDGGNDDDERDDDDAKINVAAATDVVAKDSDGDESSAPLSTTEMSNLVTNEKRTSSFPAMRANARHREDEMNALKSAKSDRPENFRSYFAYVGRMVVVIQRAWRRFRRRKRIAEIRTSVATIPKTDVDEKTVAEKPTTNDVTSRGAEITTESTRDNISVHTIDSTVTHRPVAAVPRFSSATKANVVDSKYADADGPPGVPWKTLLEATPPGVPRVVSLMSMTPGERREEDEEERVRRNESESDPYHRASVHPRQTMTKQISSFASLVDDRASVGRPADAVSETGGDELTIAVQMLLQQISKEMQRSNYLKARRSELESRADGTIASKSAVRAAVFRERISRSDRVRDLEDLARTAKSNLQRAQIAYDHAISRLEAQEKYLSRRTEFLAKDIETAKLSLKQQIGESPYYRFARKALLSSNASLASLLEDRRDESGRRSVTAQRRLRLSYESRLEMLRELRTIASDTQTGRDPAYRIEETLRRRRTSSQSRAFLWSYIESNRSASNQGMASVSHHTGLWRNELASLELQARAYAQGRVNRSRWA
eukprot:g278.t1